MCREGVEGRGGDRDSVGGGGGGGGGGEVMLRVAESEGLEENGHSLSGFSSHGTKQGKQLVNMAGCIQQSSAKRDAIKISIRTAT